ncbi:MAG: NAD(P)-dependent oxidoreductase [Pirellulales bacterium]
MASVGLIGIGLVGTAVSERLLADGFVVVGFDVDPAATERLANLGGTVVESAAAAVAACDEVLLSLPRSSDVVEVLTSCAHALHDDQLIVDTSTGAPEDAQHCGRLCAKRGVRFVEATILGSSQQVREASAVAMLGGEDAARTRAENIVTHFTSQIFHVGPLGQASRMKLAVNLVLGINRAALAEGLAFARAVELDLPQALEVFRAGAAYSRVMDAKGEKMLQREFTPQAKLSQHHKDVRLIRQAAAAANLVLPLTDAHEQLLTAAERAGHAASDNCAVIAAYDRP